MKQKKISIVLIIIVVFLIGVFFFSGKLSVIDTALGGQPQCKVVKQCTTDCQNQCDSYNDCTTFSYNNQSILCINDAVLPSTTVVEVVQGTSVQQSSDTNQGVAFGQG